MVDHTAEALVVVHAVGEFPLELVAVLLDFHKVHQNAQHCAYPENDHDVAEADFQSLEELRIEERLVVRNLEGQDIVGAVVEEELRGRKTLGAGFRRKEVSRVVVERRRRRAVVNVRLHRR